MRSLLSNLNGRLLIVHLAAFWLFFYAFQTLAFLIDPVFLNPTFVHMNHLNFPDRYNYYVTFIHQLGNIGLLIAFIASWIISSKNRWHWINCTLVFLFLFTLGNVQIHGNYYVGWDHLSHIFLAPGKIFAPGSIWGYILNGGLMLVVACILFFWKRIVRFIDNGSYQKKNAPKGKRQIAKA